MTINVLGATDENFAVMKGSEFAPKDGEGIIDIKVVAIKPSTMKDGDPQKLVDESPGVLVCGQLNDIKSQITTWFDEIIKEYNE